MSEAGWSARCACVWLCIGFEAIVAAAAADAKDVSRKVTEPPPWTGDLSQPARTCPYVKDHRSEQKILVICKLALIGNVGNIAPVVPGLYEDYEDWPYLKSYWDTDKRFFFAATGCGYDTSEGGAKYDAQVEAEKNTMRLVHRWNGVLHAGVFRGLAFHKTEQRMLCASRPLSGDNAGSQSFDESEPGEMEEPATKAPADPTTVTFVARSDDPKDVFFAAFRPDGSRVEPSPDRAWTLSSEPGTFKAACTRGERVCWGAWRKEDETVTWGAGRGPHGCASCCVACGAEREVNLNAGRDRPPPNKLTVTIDSNSPYPTDVRFYTGDRRLQYPAGDNVFSLSGNEEHTYTMTCAPGQQICYGAGVRSNYNSYWGVGVTGQQGCTGCCMTCGSGRHTFRLNGGDPTPQVTNGGGGGSGNTTTAIETGIAIGSAIGSALGGRHGGVTIPRAPSRPPIVGRPQTYGGSDISGTR